jgi:hypothetical protein
MLAAIPMVPAPWYAVPVTPPARHGHRVATTVCRHVAGVIVALFATTPATAAAAVAEWFVHTGGLSHHFQQTRAANHQWREQHPGLGIERRVTDENDWSVRTAGGFMQDSRGFWGGYGGVGYMHRWRLGRAAELGAGAGAYAFYRSVSWSGRMALVPAVLPTASVGLIDNTVGLNLVVVPRVAAYSENLAPAVHAQLVLRFR